MKRLLLICTFFAASCHFAFGHDTADALYFGGTILSMEETHGCGSDEMGVAIKNDLILWVGCLKNVPKKLIGPGTRQIDLSGRAMLPGFVDAHSHMFSNAVDLADFQARQDVVLKNGITSQAELFVNQAELNLLDGFGASGALKVRTSLYLRWNNACNSVLDEWWKAYQPVRDPRAQLRMPGLKIFSDGGVCNDAALTFPYEDATFGDLYLTAAQLEPMLKEAKKLGWQVAIHSIGDASRDEVLKAFRHVHGKKSGLQNRIEHDIIMRPEQVTQYSRVHAVPVVFGTDATCNELSSDPSVFSWHRILGASRYSWYRPLRDLIAKNPRVAVAWCLDKDGTIADGSPRPMSDHETITSIYELVTRRQVNTDQTICEPSADMLAQTIGVSQALQLMTLNAAKAIGTDSAVGSLKKGKFADFVILSQSPITTDPAALKDLAVSATIIGGIPLYCATGNEDLCAL